MKKRAFTLAEVLVALGILGVIAALTLPSLTKNNSDAGTGPLLAKTMASVEDAVGRVILDDPYTTLSSYFNEIETCDNNGENCTKGNKSADFYSKLQEYLITSSTDGGYRLKDGVVINFVDPDEKSTVGGLGTVLKDVTVDINGSKAPNSTGVDKFRFALSSQGLLVPQGHAAKIASNNWKIPKGYSDTDWSDFVLGKEFECKKECAADETLDVVACMCKKNPPKPDPDPPPPDEDLCKDKTWHETCQTCDKATGNISAINDGTSLGDCKMCEEGKEVADTTSKGCCPDPGTGTKCQIWNQATCSYDDITTGEGCCPDPGTGNACQKWDSSQCKYVPANDGTILEGCKVCKGGQAVTDTTSSGCCPDPGTGTECQIWNQATCSYDDNTTGAGCCPDPGIGKLGYKWDKSSCEYKFNGCPAGYEATTLPNGTETCMKLEDHICTQAELAAGNIACAVDQVRCQDGTIGNTSKVGEVACPNDKMPYCCDSRGYGVACADGNSWTQDCGISITPGGGSGGGVYTQPGYSDGRDSSNIIDDDMIIDSETMLDGGYLNRENSGDMAR